MTGRTTEELAELLTVLAPAPREWVIAAKELPPASELTDGAGAVAVADSEHRARAIAPMLAELRRRLDS
jgi:hypothetical protein